MLEKIIPSDFYLLDNGFDYYDYYSCHKDKIECVYNSLSDEKSKLVMQNLLQYKITRQPHLIRSIRDPIETQYFDDKIINLSYKENFWDLGAYIGDTVNTFLRLVNNKFESIVALEPDDSNFTTLVSEMKHKIGNIICLPYGIGEADSCLRLKKYSSMTSFISEEGDTTIEIRSIDSLATNKHISFLKADIEGYEKQMLSGAIKTIIRCKPKLAISVYHRKDDIFAIPLMIKELVPEYKLFLRHYTNNAVDTILYAV